MEVVITEYVDAFLCSVTEAAGDRILKKLGLLEEDNWWLLGKDGIIEKIDGIYKLNIRKCLGCEYRIFFGQHRGRHWAVHAINKKKQKIDRSDIKLAKERMKWIIDNI